MRDLTIDDTAEQIPLYDFDTDSSVDSSDSRLLHLVAADELLSHRDDPKTDGGRDAWLCLLGCWLAEAMIRGTHLSFGVFQRYYSNHELFRDSNSIPTIGALATGVSYLVTPFVNEVVIRWPQRRRSLCVAGWLLCLIGPLGASFASKAWQLVLFQGFIEGVGWNIWAMPSMFILNEHWVAKRGLATGILFGGSGVSGLVIPIAFGYTLEQYGFRIALRLYIVAIIVISGPGLLLVQRKKSLRRISGSVKPQKANTLQMLRPYVSDPQSLLIAATVFVQGLGFFIPRIFLAQYATDAGMSIEAGGGLLAIISLSQTLGQLLQGWVSDRVNIYIPLSLSALIPGLGALLLWGPGKTYATLAPFALIWGLFAASYAVLFTRVCMVLTAGIGEDDQREDVVMLLYGVLTFERGIANVLEGPISSWLISDDRGKDTAKLGMGKYASLVWFTVVVMIASSFVGVGWFWKRPRS